MSDAPTDAPIRVLGVAGSLREAAYSRRLVRLAAQLVEELDQPVEFTTFDGLGAVEPFDADAETDGGPAGAAAFRAALLDADAVLVATPEYNASIPGALKNAFDWASRAPQAPHDDLRSSAMFGRPVAVVSSSTGQFGGVWARDELVKALRTQGARAVTEPQVAVPSADDAFDGDALRSDATRAKLAELLAALVDHARTVRAARAAASTPA